MKKYLATALVASLAMGAGTALADGGKLDLNMIASPGNDVSGALARSGTLSTDMITPFSGTLDPALINPRITVRDDLGATPIDAINNSIDSDNMFGGVVAVLFYDFATQTPMSICSGSLINRRTVLTAAHCVMSGNPVQDATRQPKIFASDGSGGLNQIAGDVFGNTNFVGVGTGWVVPAEYDPSAFFLGSDIAMISLATPVTSLPFLQLAATAPSVGDKVYLTGFGGTGTGTTGNIGLPWQRLWAENTVGHVGPIDDIFFTGGMPATGGQIFTIFQDPADPSFWPDLINFIVPGVNFPDTIQDREGSTAGGDSGGPLLIQDPDTGEFLIVGVTSGGASLGPCGSTSCYGDLAFWTLVTDFLNWISEYNPLQVAMAAPGDGNFSDAAHWAGGVAPANTWSIFDTFQPGHDFSAGGDTFYDVLFNSAGTTTFDAPAFWEVDSIIMAHDDAVLHVADGPGFLAAVFETFMLAGTIQVDGDFGTGALTVTGSSTFNVGVTGDVIIFNPFTFTFGTTAILGGPNSASINVDGIFDTGDLLVQDGSFNVGETGDVFVFGDAFFDNGTLNVNGDMLVLGDYFFTNGSQGVIGATGDFTVVGDALFLQSSFLVNGAATFASGLTAIETGGIHVGPGGVLLSGDNVVLIDSNFTVTSGFAGVNGAIIALDGSFISSTIGGEIQTDYTLLSDSTLFIDHPMSLTDPLYVSAFGIDAFNSFIAGRGILATPFAGGVNLFGSTLFPGNPFNTPGLMVVVGDLFLDSNSTLALEFNGIETPSLPFGGSFLQVVEGPFAFGGNAHIDGSTLVAMAVDGYVPQWGDVLPFATAENGITGGFSSVVDNLPGVLFWHVIQPNANTLALVTLALPYSLFAANEAQAAVAGALDDFRSGLPLGGHPDIYNALDPLGLDGPLQLALQTLYPNQVFVQNAFAMSFQNMLQNQLRSRAGSSRMGGGGGGASMAGLRLPQAQIASNDPGREIMLAAAQANHSAAAATTRGHPWSNAFSLPHRMTAFLAGDLDTGNFSRLGSQADFQSWAITAGVDYKLYDNVVVGVAASHLQSDSSNSTLRYDISGKGWALSAFGSVHSRGMYLDAYASVGWLDFDSERDIIIGSTLVKAEGSSDGLQFITGADLGYLHEMDNVRFGPLVRYSYSHLTLKGFTETGAGGFGATISERKIDSFQVGYGAQLAIDAVTPGGRTLTLSGRLTKEHILAQDDTLATAQLIATPGSPFSVGAPAVDRNFWTAQVGIAAVLADNAAGFLAYETDFARSDLNSHRIMGGVRIGF